MFEQIDDVTQTPAKRSGNRDHLQRMPAIIMIAAVLSRRCVVAMPHVEASSAISYCRQNSGKACRTSVSTESAGGKVMTRRKAARYPLYNTTAKKSGTSEKSVDIDSNVHVLQVRYLPLHRKIIRWTYNGSLYVSKGCCSCASLSLRRWS